jgi:hypothetical protein
VSTLDRSRSRCQVCGNTYRGRPVEVLVHGWGHGGSYWKYSTRRLCFVCKQAQLDFWFPAHVETRPVVTEHHLPPRNLTAADLEDLVELEQWPTLQRTLLAD